MPTAYASWQIVGQRYGGPFPVAAINYANLSTFRELRLEVFNITHSAGTPNLEIVWSLDNGGTFQGAGEYGRYGINAGDSSIVLCGTTAVSPASYSAIVEINNFNVNLNSFVRVNGGQDNTASSVQTLGGFQVNGNILNALRLRWSTLTNIVAATTVTLYGKVG